jgi:hypothetical protein
MAKRRIYVSCTAEDAQSVQPLCTVLDAAGVTVVTAQPDSIGTTDGFIACLASGSGATARYNRDELRRAMGHGCTITFAKLTPCPVPSVRGIAPNVVVLDLQERWTESIAHVLAPPRTTAPTAQFVYVGEEAASADDMEFLNVDIQGAAGGPDGNSIADITIKSTASDGKMSFTNVRRR